MNFCSACGHGPLDFVVPAGDNRERFVCPSCGVVHYSNPKVVVGTIPEWEGKILLCRRAIEPRLGLWTLPAGFMENHETTDQGAVRETLEESQAQVQPLQLYAVFSIPHISQVYMMYRASMQSTEFGVTSETSELALFALDEIPWDELAFPVVRATLEAYVQDAQSGRFEQHHGVIVKPAARG